MCMKGLFRNIIYYLHAWTAIMLAIGCSSEDYTNVIPANISGLMAIDSRQLLDRGTGGASELKLARLLETDRLADCGIAFDERLYAFETVDGTLGLLAKVQNMDDVKDWLGHLKDKGLYSDLAEKKGVIYGVFKEHFIVGLTDNALLVIGPVLGSEQNETRRKMARMFNREGDNSSPFVDIVNEMDSPVCIAAKADALPEKFVAPFILAVPKGTKMSDVNIKATIQPQKNVMLVKGDVYAKKESVNAALQTAQNTYTQIPKHMLDRLPADNVLTLACGVKGKEVLSALRSNETFRTMLLGLNTAIDFDSMLKSVEGGLVLTVQEIGDDRWKYLMVADTKDNHWLRDIDYWMKSCPKGSTIIKDKTATNAYQLIGNGQSLYFGTQGNLLYMASNKALAGAASETPSATLPFIIRQLLTDSRLAVIVNVDKLVEKDKGMKTAWEVLCSLLGDFSYLVYKMDK